MEDKRTAARRVLKDIGGEAKRMRADALKAKFSPPAPPEEEAPTDVPMDGPLPDGEGGLELGAEAPVDEGAAELEEAKAALAKLDDAQVQELLATLKPSPPGGLE